MSAVFNGATSYIAIPTGNYLNFGNQWTISWWFKVNGTGTAHQHYFYHRSGIGLTGDNTISARFNETTNGFVSFFRDSATTAADNSITTGELAGSGWYHAVMVRQRNRSDSTTVLRLYINDVLVDEDNTHICTGFNFTTPLFLGRRGDTTTSVVLSGQMAEFAKFDRCLTRREITQIYSGHDPQLLSNGSPTFYLPLRNDSHDRIVGFTGLNTNMSFSLEHPVPDKSYVPINDIQNVLPQLDARVGNLEQRGYIDYFDVTLGTILGGGFIQTGIPFPQAKRGSAYVLAPDYDLGGCIIQAYASGGNGISGGYLTVVCSNVDSGPVTLPSIRFGVYRL